MSSTRFHWYMKCEAAHAAANYFWGFDTGGGKSRLRYAGGEHKVRRHTSYELQRPY
jgi:hypothetical protein